MDDHYEYLDENDNVIPNTSNTMPVAMEDDSLGGSLKQFGKTLGARAAYAPTTTAKNVGSLIEALPEQNVVSSITNPASLLPTAYKIAKPIAEKISEGYENLVGRVIPKENLKQGENLLSESIYKVADNLPALALSGGLNASNLLRDFGSSVGMTAAETLLPEDGILSGVGKVAASVLGGIGFNKLANIYNKAPNIRSAYINDTYKQVSELGSKIPQKNAKDITDTLKNIKKEAELASISKKPGKYFSESDKSAVTKNIDNWTKQLKNLKKSNNLNAETLRQLKIKMNDAYSGTKSVSDVFYKRALSPVLERLESIAKDNPKWGKYYNTANEVFQLDNWKKGLWETLKEDETWGQKALNILKHPTAQAAFSILGGVGSHGLGLSSLPSLASAGIGSAIAAGHGAQLTWKEILFIKQLFQTKEGQKIFWNLMGNAAKHSKNGIVKSLTAFDKFANKLDKEQEDNYEYL